MSNINVESSNKKRGLGRGLGSLLGSAEPQNKTPQINKQSVSTQAVSIQSSQVVDTQIKPEDKIWHVGIEKLSSGKYQPRKHFEKASLEELAVSIKENDILQPIVVRRTTSGQLEIIAGERRWRAAQLAGKHKVPVIIKDLQDKEALELAIVENIQREDLNPIEEADGYHRLATEFNLSQQQVAEKVGKDRATVANAIRILSLPKEVKEMIVSGLITTGHAKVLLSLSKEEHIISTAKQIVSQKMSVRKLEKIIKKQQDVEEKSFKEEVLNGSLTEQLIKGLGEEVQKMLGTKVTIDYNNTRGKINIYFYSDSELTHIVERLREGCQK